MNNLLLLHGAIGSSVQLEPIADLLKDSFNVYLLNFSGHGGKEIPEEPFSIEMFANDVLYFIDKGKLGKVDIYGYSMGGYVGLYLAKNFSDKVNKIFTTATKFDWSAESALKESKLLNPEKIIEKIPKFAEQLSRLHHPADWKEVLQKTAEMMIQLGKNNVLKDDDFEQIENEIMVSVGDRDIMVSIEETVNAYRKLINGRLLVLPDTQHPVEKISAARLAFEIENFFREWLSNDSVSRE